MTKTDIDAQISDWPYSECHGPIEGIVAVANARSRPIRFRDEQGFDDVILAGAIHATSRRIAYVGCRHRSIGSGFTEVNFTLFVPDSEGIIRRHELPSYNQFFGCRVQHFAWHGDQIVCIYREKHDTYALTVGANNEARHVAISDKWLVEGDILYLPCEDDHFFVRIQLPSLTSLRWLPREEAEQRGLNLRKYGKSNDWRRWSAARRTELMSGGGA